MSIEHKSEFLFDRSEMNKSVSVKFTSCASVSCCYKPKQMDDCYNFPFSTAEAERPDDEPLPALFKDYMSTIRNRDYVYT